MPDAARARAGVLRLEAEASPSNMHTGTQGDGRVPRRTVKVFLAWLAARGAERDYGRRPDPTADSTEAVEVVT